MIDFQYLLNYKFKVMNKKRLISILIIIGLTAVIFILNYHPTITVITKKNPRDGADMVWVPAGPFMMGSPETRRKVILDGFWIYKYEVTVKQFRNYCKKNKYHYDWKKNQPTFGWHDENPMTNMNWDDADSYSKWVGGSLPTGAQWEKAARGNDERDFPWGNKWNVEWFNNGANLIKIDAVTSDKAVIRHGGYFPKDCSPYGAMDMEGNVAELTSDAMNELIDIHMYVKLMSGVNPNIPVTQKTEAVLMRGGDFDSIPYGFPTFGSTMDPSLYSYRYHTRSIGYYAIGFRCVVP